MRIEEAPLDSIRKRIVAAHVQIDRKHTKKKKTDFFILNMQLATTMCNTTRLDFGGIDF